MKYLLSLAVTVGFSAVAWGAQAQTLENRVSNLEHNMQALGTVLTEISGQMAEMQKSLDQVTGNSVSGMNMPQPSGSLCGLEVIGPSAPGPMVAAMNPVGGAGTFGIGAKGTSRMPCMGRYVTEGCPDGYVPYVLGGISSYGSMMPETSYPQLLTTSVVSCVKK